MTEGGLYYFQVGKQDLVGVLEDGGAEFLENDSNEQDGFAFRIDVLENMGKTFSLTIKNVKSFN